MSYPHITTPADYQWYTEAVARGLKGLHAVSTGHSTKCHECKDRDPDEPGEEFSWSNCDVCTRNLGGRREPAHGIDNRGQIIHMDVCVDCVYFINYGTLDDATMLSIDGDDTPKEDM